ncbi:hypothetical protein OSTOST_24642, partial [Ostertagia ostertagi]
MAAIIWGNREVVSRRRQITKRVAEHPELQDPYSQAFMTRTEHMDHAARKATNMLKDLDALDVNPVNMNEMYHLTNEVIGISGYPLALHGIMFIPTLQAQCADDQMHWLEKAMTKQIIGTYAQTELGH